MAITQVAGVGRRGRRPRLAGATQWLGGPLLFAASLACFGVLWGPLALQGLTGPSVRLFATAILAFCAYFIPLVLLRIAVAAAKAAARGELRAFFRVSPGAAGWLWDSGWLLSAHAMLGMTYSWCKLYLPAYGGKLWDARLARVDLAVHFGVNPNVFMLTLAAEGPRWAARVIDAEYAAFVTSMLVITAWFLGDGERRRRMVFATANWFLWTVGLVGYIALPALGPALAVDGLREEVAASFPIAASAQLALQHNYANVLRMLAHPGRDYLISPSLGVAAMPSMHVAAHTFLFLWALLSRSLLRTPLLIVAGLTFIGSIATGWHYAVDSWAGAALAAATAFLARLVLGRMEPRRNSGHASFSPDGSE